MHKLMERTRENGERRDVNKSGGGAGRGGAVGWCGGPEGAG